MTTLVTGGLGYIGAHVAWALVEAGERVVVVDDGSCPHPNPLPQGTQLVVADIADGDAMRRVAREHAPDAMVHCAGLIQVGESVQRPDRYWRVNLSSSAAMLDALRAEGIVPAVVFSSSAAVYGAPAYSPMDEAHPLAPVSPYGATKLALERVLSDYERAFGMRSICLRYFNAAGSRAGCGLAERHEPETHLIPLAIDAALGKRDALTVFGTDWDTPDGTCVRDYVHVDDIAEVHVAAIRHLRRGGASARLNVGTGRGHSVREVIRAVEAASGREVPLREGARREGDPSTLVAAVGEVERVLGWRATRSALDAIVGSAVAARR